MRCIITWIRTQLWDKLWAAQVKADTCLKRICVWSGSPFEFWVTRAGPGLETENHSASGEHLERHWLLEATSGQSSELRRTAYRSLAASRLDLVNFPKDQNMSSGWRRKKLLIKVICVCPREHATDQEEKKAFCWCWRSHRTCNPDYVIVVHSFLPLATTIRLS